MKGKSLRFCGRALFAASAWVMLGCGGLLQTSSPAYDNAGKTAAGEGEAEIIVNRPAQDAGRTADIAILVDGQERLRLKNGESGTIIVPNGNHTVRATGPLLNNSGAVTVTAKSNTIVFETRYNYPIELNKRNESWSFASTPSASSQTAPPSSSGPSKGIDGAAQKTTIALMRDLPKGATVAVINVSSNDDNASSVALNEVEFHLVSAKAFTIVDRNTLDAIRKEQQLQMSGDVSDASIVAIGNLAGANVVITGDITNIGKDKRLSLKALDVKTGRIISMARENY